MVTGLILFVFLVFGLAGCAPGSKKQVIQPQPVASEKFQTGHHQESSSREYTYVDTWSSDSYGKPAKKTHSEPSLQLSPKQIQRALKSAGFYDGPIDGKIGPKTKAAVLAFQKANGLKADGIVGKRTAAALNKYLPR